MYEFSQGTAGGTACRYCPCAHSETREVKSTRERASSWGVCRGTLSGRPALFHQKASKGESLTLLSLALRRGRLLSLSGSRRQALQWAQELSRVYLPTLVEWDGQSADEHGFLCDSRPRSACLPVLGYSVRAVQQHTAIRLESH